MKGVSWGAAVVRIVIGVILGAACVLIGRHPIAWAIGSVVLWVVLCTFRGVVQGKDEPWSTSKFQLVLWTGAIAYCLVGCLASKYWVDRQAGAPPPSFPEFPEWMWVALGLSATTAIAAKGVTVGYIDSQRLQPSTANDQGQGPKGPLGLLADDSGTPQLGKIQMLFWTLLAIVYVVYDATRNLLAVGPDSQAIPGLPDLPAGVLVLTGLSQGVYVSGKLFDAEKPRITAINPSSAKVDARVKIAGAHFGTLKGDVRIELDGIAVMPETATDNEIEFKVPAPPGRVVRVRVFVREVPAVNESRLTIEP